MGKLIAGIVFLFNYALMVWFFRVGLDMRKPAWFMIVIALSAILAGILFIANAKGEFDAQPTR